MRVSAQSWNLWIFTVVMRIDTKDKRVPEKLKFAGFDHLFITKIMEDHSSTAKHPSVLRLVMIEQFLFRVVNSPDITNVFTLI